VTPEKHSHSAEIADTPSESNVNREREIAQQRLHVPQSIPLPSLYEFDDYQMLMGNPAPAPVRGLALQTLDDLLRRDQQREEDGFPRRIRIGKLVRPGKDKKDRIIVVPTTTEPKFYHDDSFTDEEMGGTGEGEVGEVIGEQAAKPEPGEGEGTGAGQGEGADHEVTSNAYELGKILTEKFSLPNLQQKGNKRSFTRYRYELTDRNRGFGQVLDKKATLREIVRTNVMLGRIDGTKPIDTEELMLSPRDRVFRILSREKDFETQALVFFVRDYSGSMQGAPTEVIATQHLFIYSWLVYQYNDRVDTRFILHDTDAKEVPDFHTYYNSQVAGGTKVHPAYELVNKIVQEEQLVRDYNIYVFHGTDGDDWDNDGAKSIEALKEIMGYAGRVGITVARNSWSNNGETAVEKYLNRSGLLKERTDLLRLDALTSEGASESRIIESIRKLIS